MRRRALAIASSGLVLAAGIAYVATRDTSKPSGSDARSDSVRIASADVPEGVSGYDIHQHPFFIVRDGNRITAFVDDAQHLANERLWWCATERVFVAPTHGETFDEAGRKLAGPSQRDLDRYAARFVGSDLVVTLTQPQRGQSRGWVGDGPYENARYTGPWNSGGSSFCDGAISATGHVPSSPSRQG